MQIDTQNDKLIRENWKEWFRIEVGAFAYTLEKFRLPKGFVKTHSAQDKDIDYYWFILFVPFVKFGLWFQKAWWIIPKWLYKKGYFQHNEGEVEHWFWFKKIRLTPTKKANKRR